MVITEEAKQRMDNLVGVDHVWFDKKMKRVSSKTKGLGYKWYPIVVKTDLDTSSYNIVIHPNINIFRGCDTEKTVTYSNDQVIKEVVLGILNREHPDYYHGLSFNRNFLDPLKVSNAIEYLEGTGRLLGFMGGFDTIKLEIDGETFYFDQNRCLNKNTELKTRCYKLDIGLNFVEEDHNRIFNAVMTISIKKRKNIPTELDIIIDENTDLYIKMIYLATKLRMSVDKNINKNTPKADEDPMKFYQNQRKTLLETISNLEKHNTK